MSNQHARTIQILSASRALTATWLRVVKKPATFMPQTMAIVLALHPITSMMFSRMAMTPSARTAPPARVTVKNTFRRNAQPTRTLHAMLARFAKMVNLFSRLANSHTKFSEEKQRTLCAQDCKELETPRDSYVTTLCIKDLESDFQLLPCTKCQPGEWTKTACEIGSESSLGIDTDCDDCTHIAGCKAGSVRCTDDQDQLCSGCADNDDTKAQFDTWGHCCEDGFMGDRCGWKIVETGCDAAGNSFKERTARSGGWINSRDEKTNANFVNWCRKFCDSEDECTAYEVEDCLFGDEYCVVDDTKCKLKFHAEYLFDGEAGQTCVTRPPPV